MKYTVQPNGFTEIDETEGTIQNIGYLDVEINNVATKATGLILRPKEKFSWTGGALQVRGMGGSVEVAVIPFKKGGEGGGGGGQRGYSAYEIAVQEGFVGTKAEWLESLKGIDGDDGQDGKSFTIHSQYETYEALIAAHPTGNAGDAYFVGTDNNPDLYIWLSDTKEWFNAGKIAGVKGDKGDKGDTGASKTFRIGKVKQGTSPSVTATEVNNVVTLDFVIPYSGAGVPVGTIINFMGTKAPSNYLICDGTVYNIDEYYILSEFIKEQFGSSNYFGGDGTTTFAVPDLRGEFLRGSGTNSHANQGSGANVGVHQDATKHDSATSFVDTNNNFGILGNIVTGSATNEFHSPQNVDFNDRAGKYQCNTVRNNYTGVKWSSPNSMVYYTSRPTNTSVLYCIKYI